VEKCPEGCHAKWTVRTLFARLLDCVSAIQVTLQQRFMGLTRTLYDPACPVLFHQVSTEEGQDQHLVLSIVSPFRCRG
jgi:hypothetical protein